MIVQTKSVDPYLYELELKDPKFCQLLLQEMVKFPIVHKGLVQHGGTSVEILLQVIAQYENPASYPPEIFANPNCPRELIDKRLKNIIPNSESLKMLASNESLNRQDLSKLLTLPELAPIMAERSNLPADLFVHIWENYLVDLSDAKFSLNLPLLQALATNPKTPLKILHNLSKYELIASPGHVKSLLMSNPAFPSEVKAEYALHNIKTAEIKPIQIDDWYLTNLVFGINSFPEQFLVELIKVGHPGGLLRTEEIPPVDQSWDSRAIFDMWIHDQSIYKTLWPELKDAESFPSAFFRWYKQDEGFTFFEIEGVDFEHEQRQEDGDFNFHGIPESPVWLPYEINESEDLLEFKLRDFQEVANWGILEWVEAWNLANYDPKYISLVDEDEKTTKFISEQFLDLAYDWGLIFEARVDAELVRPYSWKALPLAKKSFLIEFIINVYLNDKDPFSDYGKYAEHFLVCICLNPNTDDELIQKYFVEATIGSHLVDQALEVRKSR